MREIKVTIIGRDSGNSRPLKETDNKKEIIRELAIEALRSSILLYERLIKKISDDPIYFESLINDPTKLFRITEWEKENE